MDGQRDQPEDDLKHSNLWTLHLVKRPASQDSLPYSQELKSLFLQGTGETKKTISSDYYHQKDPVFRRMNDNTTIKVLVCS
jgi:hypothetical protein